MLYPLSYGGRYGAWGAEGSATLTLVVLAR